MSAGEGLDQGSLVKSVSIEGLLAKRGAVLEQTRRAIEALHQARQVATDGGFLREYYGYEWMLQGSDHYRRTDLLEHDALEKFGRRLDAAAWNHLMHESGLLTFMDAKARTQWREKIDQCDTPALTRDNITATFGELYAARADMFERGVIQCFRNLSWDYKTNNPARFGRRIVVRYLATYGHFRFERLDELADLQRVFCVLDGKPEEDHRSGFINRLSAAFPTGHRGRGEHDDTYVHLRWFKNGNGHLTFKRTDLVAKMNDILAKHFPNVLPPARD